MLECGKMGRPSADPVVLFKMVLIQHLYRLPSLRRTAEQISGSINYRWFLGYILQEETPLFSKGENVTIDTLGRICQALNCTIEEIVEFIDAPANDDK